MELPRIGKIPRLNRIGWFALTGVLLGILGFLFVMTGRVFVEILGWLFIPFPKRGAREHHNPKEL